PPPIPDTNAVCIVSPDTDHVLLLRDFGTDWTDLGGDAAEVYGGGYGRFVTGLVNGNIYNPNWGPRAWELIGGPGRQFAVTSEGLYGITPNGQAVGRYDGSGSSWSQIGGPADRLYAGRYGLVATAP